MSGIISQKGFTLTEIMIALAIMALGFLAMAQMQYLSLRQKQQAELGTVATNIIQFIADRDMEEVKRAHLLNSIAFMAAQAGNLTDDNLKYCQGDKNLCDGCPCNPLKALAPDLDDNSVTVQCAVINIHDSDPEDVEFKTQVSDCEADSQDALIVVKLVKVEIDEGNGNDPTITMLNVTYGVKSKKQFEETDFESLSIKNTLVTQNMVFTAHEEDWSRFVPSWTEVNIPHVP